MTPPLPPPGWYADPSGRPDRLRWWDGDTWSTLVREPGGRRWRTPWLLLGASLAVALIAVIAIPAWLRTTAPVPTGQPSSAPASPTISAEPPSVGPTRGTSDQACVSGDPTHRQAHPRVPGQAFGGGYRYAVAPGWVEGPAPDLPFGNDLTAGRPSAAGSPAWFAIGAIRADVEDFAAPQLAARAIADCLNGSSAVQGLVKVDAVSVPTEISGTRETASVLAHYGPDSAAPTRTVVIVVSDTGAAESMPFFIAVGSHDGTSSDTSMLQHRERLSRTP